MKNDEFKMQKFFKLNRKLGFQKTIEILSEFENFEVKQSKFLKICKDRKISINLIYSARKEMLSFDLIDFRKNNNYEKIVYLTKKGKKIFNMILEIEDLLS